MQNRLHSSRENFLADLSKLASTKIVVNNRLVIQEEIEEPSIGEAANPTTCSVELEHNWQQSIIKYLVNGKIVEEENKTKKLRRTVSFYTIVAGELYC